MLRKLYEWSSIKLRTLIKGAEAIENAERAHIQIHYSEPARKLPLPTSTSAEQALTKWRQGDQIELQNMRVEDLRDHPDRAHLALAFGAANLNIGNSEAARTFVRCASDWGCDKKVIAKFLIADVEKTLARASKLSTFQRIGNQNIGGENARLRLDNLDSPKLSENCGREENKPTKKHSDSFSSRHDSVNIKNDSDVEHNERYRGILAAIESQNRKIEALSRGFHAEIRNVSSQLEAVIRIQSYLDTGRLLPPFHGWPVSPDIACLLMQKIERKPYDIILEFGSGTSTVLIARSLDRLQHRQRPLQVAFEHLEKYRSETAALLRESKLEHHKVELVLAPLSNTQGDDKTEENYKFYECQSKLSDLARKYSSASLNLLVIIDGPPGLTGRHARFPAVPTVLSAFPHAAIDFILDDTKRTEEQEIVAMWTKILDERGRQYELITYDFEKGATLLEIQGSEH